jgi:hypothetical protein
VRRCPKEGAGKRTCRQRDLPLAGAEPAKVGTHRASKQIRRWSPREPPDSVGLQQVLGGQPMFVG